MSFKQFIQTREAQRLTAKLGKDKTARLLAVEFRIPEPIARKALLAVDTWREVE